MCDKQSYREAGYTPRKPEELWAESPMNPERKKTRREMEFIEETMR